MATTEAAPRTGFTLGFQSQDEEVTVDSLPVSGDVPEWLTGALVRVTPALLEVGGRRLAHWFDGIAMLNRFGFADGRVSYGSRFIESRAYDDAKQGEWKSGGVAPHPRRAVFKRGQPNFSPPAAHNTKLNPPPVRGGRNAMTQTPPPRAVY